MSNESPGLSLVGSHQTPHGEEARDRAAIAASSGPGPSGPEPAPVAQADAEPGAFLAVLGITVLGAFLRLATLNSRSFWLDEATSVRQATWPLTELITKMSDNVHPPLFHVLLHLWIHFFGKSEVAVRLFPAVFGIASIPLIYWAGRAVYGRRVGLISAAVLALAPFFVWYSQEARMYSMMLFFAVAATGTLWKAMKENRWYWWALYGLSTAGGVMTQYFFILLTGMQALYLLLYVLMPKERLLAEQAQNRFVWTRPWRIVNDVPELGGWLLSMLILAAPLSWWLPLFLSHQGTYDLASQPLNYGWSAPTIGLHFNELAAVPFQVFLGFHSQQVTRDLVAMWPLVITLVFLCVGFAVRISRRSTFLFMTGAGSAIILAALGQWQPVLDARYFTAFLAPIVILFARFLAGLSPKTFRILVSLLVVVSMVNWADQSFNHDNIVKWDNREAMSVITRNWQPGDVVVMVPFFVSSIAEYYLPPGIYAVTRGLPGYDAKGNLRTTREQISQDLSKQTGSAQRVWLISSWQDTPLITTDREYTIQGLINRGYTFAREWRFHRIGVSLFTGQPQTGFLIGDQVSPDSTSGVGATSTPSATTSPGVPATPAVTP